MKARHVIMLAALAMTILTADTGLASDKPYCELQLAEVSIQTRNLDEHRDATEKALAKEQFKSYLLSQKVGALERQLADLKKAAEPKDTEKPKE